MEAFSRVNWVDLIAIIIILRVSYLGSFIGIGIQILPLLSLLFTLTVSIYYYDNISLFITQRSTLSRSVTEFFVFIIIISIVVIVSKIINKYMPFKRPEVLVPFERVGGMLMGLLISTITIGLLYITFILLPVKGFKESVKDSMSGDFIVKLNLDFYTNTVNAILKQRYKNKDKEYVKLVTQGVLAQLTKEKDCEFKLFNFELKEKARFFKKKEE